DAAIWWHDRHLTEWEIKRQLAASQHLDVLQAARMFAMVDLAQADAAIVCFTEKATWSFWRPVTAVQLADTDGNPATAGDPAWMPPRSPTASAKRSCSPTTGGGPTARSRATWASPRARPNGA